MNSDKLKSYSHIYMHNKNSRVKLWFFVCAGVFLIFLFLPWTQNIRSKGTVTTLYQDQRPQQVNTIIGGRIMKWHIKEGDYVKAGDTLVQLTEVKADYLDPNLLQRTQQQLAGKQQSVEYYKSKVGVADQQIGAINSGLQLKLNQLLNKLNQLQLKVQSDSAEMIAANNDYIIGNKQYSRQKAMYDSGLVSLTQLETRNQQFQNALAKKTGILQSNPLHKLQVGRLILLNSKTNIPVTTSAMACILSLPLKADKLLKHKKRALENL